MIMNNKQNMLEESSWEQFENRIKDGLFYFMNKIQQNQTVSSFFYKLLVLIEAVQFLLYSIHPKMDYLFKNDVFKYFQLVVKYFQFEAIMEDSNQSLFYAFLYISFTIQFLGLVMFIFCLCNIKTKGKIYTLMVYIVKVMNLYGVCLVTVLTFPFFTIFFSVLFCHTESDLTRNISCYSGMFYLHFSMAIIGFLCMLPLLIVFLILLTDLNPNSTVPYAQPYNRIAVYKLFMKLIITLYIILDYNASLMKTFTIVLFFFYLILLVLRYKSLQYYNRSINQIVILSEITLLWTSLVVIIQAYLDLHNTNELGFFYLVLGVPFKYFAFEVLSQRKIRYSISRTQKQIKKDTDFEEHIYNIISYIEHRDDPYKKMMLEGILKMHIEECMKSGEQCSCSSLYQDNVKDDDNTSAKTKLWYILVKGIMDDGLQRFQKSARLHLLYAYIMQDKLRNKFKALFELMIAEENKPNLQEEFSIYVYKTSIEQEMKESDVKNNEQKGVDINVIVLFQNKFINFQESIQLSVNLHLEFWRELLEDNPDISKLQGLGSRITSSLDSSEESFNKLMNINNNHIKCLEIYGYFLKDIVNDANEAQKILDKAEYLIKTQLINKQFLDNDRQKYGENSNTCIITCSGNYNNMGIITNCNNEITRILGFNKLDIIGQKVNRVMPKIYSDYHDTFMNNFLDTSESKVLGLERLVLALNIDGFIIPSTLMIQVLPNLKEGISIVGFLKDIDENISANNDAQVLNIHYIIYNADSYVVMGITQNCYDSFGIPPSLVYGNNSNTTEFMLDQICPDLVDSMNQEQLKSITGFSCQLDTTNLIMNYLIALNESDDENDVDFLNDDKPLDISNIRSDQNVDPNTLNNSLQNRSIEMKKSKNKEKKEKYRKARIRAQLVDEQQIEDLKIHTIKFIEVNEDESNMKTKTMDKDDEKQEEVKEEKEEQDIKRMDQVEMIQQSEADSQGSGVSLNEDIRLLKDFKNLMSEKSESKNVKILKRTVFMMVVCLIIITSVELNFKSVQNDDVYIGKNAIFNSYMRHNLMADVCFYSRMLDLLSRDLYLPREGQTMSQAENQIKANLSIAVDLLQQTQFAVIKAKIIMEQSQSEVPQDKQYNVSFLLQDKTVKFYENIFNDALFQLLTSASALRNATLDSFAESDVVESTQKNFYYVIENGYYTLRRGSEELADDFFNYYKELIDDYQTIFIIFLAITIFVLVVSQGILIPIVFQIHTINSKVLSLFGLISLDEIKKLADQCERQRNRLKCFSYKKNYLDDLKLKSGGNNQEAEQQQQQENKNEGEGKEQQEQNIIQEIDNEPKEEEQQRIVATNIADNQTQNKVKQKPEGFIQGLVKDEVKPQEKQEEEKEKEEELRNLRSQKLFNSKNNARGIIMVKFGFIACVFIGYIVANFILQLVYLDDINILFNHLRLISMRPSNLKFLVYFTIEEIVAMRKNYEEKEDIRDKFNQRVYNTERQIFTSIKETYPKEFDSYLEHFRTYNYENLCEQQFTYKNFTMNDLCPQIDNGLLKKGIRTTIISVALKTTEIINDFEAEDNQANQINVINSQIFDNFLYILKYVIPALNYESQIFREVFDEFLDYSNQLEQIKFSCFIITLVFTFLIIWLPYNNNLSKQIWRTKGMLNMIPIDIIQNQDQLKFAFLQGDIIKGVK